MIKKCNKFAYCRCSTSKQDALYEVETLLAKGVPREHIYVEYISGTKVRNERPEYNKLMSILEENPGSELYATDLYRIARNVHDMIELIDIVNKYKIKLDVGELKVDCRENNMSLADEIVIMLFGVLGNFENKVKAKNTSLGIQAAKNSGKHVGRIKVTKEILENNPNFLKYYLQWKQKKITLSEFQRLYGVKSRNTCYNHIHIYERN